MPVENMPAYPLKEVLEVKQRRIDQAELVVKEKKKLLEQEQEKLKQREAERDKVKKHYKDKLDQYRRELDEGTTSTRIDQSKIYMKVVQERLQQEEKKVRDQKAQVDLAEKNLEIAKNVLRDRRKEKDKIEMHKKEWTKETTKELEIEEERTQDDIGSTMFLTRMIRDKQDNKRK